MCVFLQGTERSQSVSSPFGPPGAFKERRKGRRVKRGVMKVSSISSAAASAASETASAAPASPSAAAPASGEAASAAPAAAAAASSAAAAAAATAAATAAAAALLRQEALHGQKLVGRDVELVPFGVRGGDDALRHLDREHRGVDRAEDLLHLAHLGLVLQEDGAVEVGHLPVRRAREKVG